MPSDYDDELYADIRRSFALGYCNYHDYSTLLGQLNALRRTQRYSYADCGHSMDESQQLAQLEAFRVRHYIRTIGLLELLRRFRLLYSAVDAIPALRRESRRWGARERAGRGRSSEGTPR